MHPGGWGEGTALVRPRARRKNELRGFLSNVPAIPAPCLWYTQYVSTPLP